MDEGYTIIGSNFGGGGMKGGGGKKVHDSLGGARLFAACVPPPFVSRVCPFPLTCRQLGR